MSSSSDDFSLDASDAPLQGAPQEDREIAWAPRESGGFSELLGFDLMSEPGVDRSGLNALINSAFIAHRRMPMLDVILDRTARRMTRSLRQMTDENVEVTLDDVGSIRFADFVHANERATVFGVMRSTQLQSYCLIAADAGLIRAVVDLLLGGRRGAGAFIDPARQLTPIEIGLAQRLFQSMIADVNESFRMVFDMAFVLERIETTPRFAAIVQEPSVCALGKLQIRFGDLKAKVLLVFPHVAIEPIREQLARNFIGEVSATEGLWRRRLSAEVRAAAIDVEAILAERTMSIGDLAKLGVGETLVFTKSSREPVTLRARGCAIAEARLGRAGERIAVRLNAIGGSVTAPSDNQGAPS